MTEAERSKLQALVCAQEARASVDLTGHSVAFRGDGSTVMGCPWLRFTIDRLKVRPTHAFMLLDWGAAGKDQQSIEKAVAELVDSFGIRHSKAALAEHCAGDPTTQAIFSHPQMADMIAAGSCLIMNAIWGLRLGDVRRSSNAVPKDRLKAGWRQVSPIIEVIAPATVVFMHADLRWSARPAARSFSTAGQRYPLAPVWAKWREYINDKSAIPSWINDAEAMDVRHPSRW